ncbi:MAG: hypothetical protein HOJ95_07230 [Nitrospinaceae bacterium]|jgi:hypothetical protein|nr:hypothetical protein [Nitrospinaceae bacterium]MBT3434014.1 hypothetical protein [Nitrospinaceae bacterium]MBT5369527.1 hypothetical protein [Nitrospinaceae bacterium]MBT5947611.1 hypothetical protein [Nitrospinaceae bacterium]MBT6394480.1 hypothetical protein [Nitrospinaceae bacterium]
MVVSLIMKRAGLGLLAAPLIFWRLDPAGVLDRAGWLWMLHALHLLMAGGVALLLVVIGRWALGRAELIPEDRLERLLLSACTGFLLFSAVVYVVAEAGWLHPLQVLALAVAAALWAFMKDDEPTALGATPARIREEGQAGEPAKVAARVLGGVLSLIFLGALIEALYPSPQSPDALAYNVAFARMFASAGDVVSIPESPFFFATTGYWEFLLTAVALFTPSDVSLFTLAQLLHVILGLGGTALGIVCLTRRLLPLGEREALALGLFAALLFAGMRIDVYHVRRFPLLIVAPKSDLFIATLQMGGALAFLEAMRLWGDVGRRWALLGGLIIGAASGVKLTSGLAAIGLGAGFMFIPLVPLGMKDRLRLAGWVAAGIAVGLAPMLAKNLIELGNPLYPLLASFFGKLENPRYFDFAVQGYRDAQASRLDTGARMLLLALPSAPFFFIFGALWPRLAPRGVYPLLIAIATSVAVATVVFSGKFPSRYALFISALSAVCAAAIAGGLIARILNKEGVGRLLTHRAAVPVAWSLLVALAVIPTHLDNRLKRAFRTVSRSPGLEARMLAMNPTARFQAGWPGRLPPDARPITFYRSERLTASTLGWRPHVLIEAPPLMKFFLGGPSGAEAEKELLKRRFTHFYFESSPPSLPGFPIDTGPLTKHLEEREPLWRSEGLVIYTLGPSVQ